MFYLSLYLSTYQYYVIFAIPIQQIPQTLIVILVSTIYAPSIPYLTAKPEILKTTISPRWNNTDNRVVVDMQFVDPPFANNTIEKN